MFGNFSLDIILNLNRLSHNYKSRQTIKILKYYLALIFIIKQNYS